MLAVARPPLEAIPSPFDTPSDEAISSAGR
jgi:hypothetical protein